MPRQKGFAGYQEDNEIYKDDGDCENLVYTLDPSLGYRRWYCNFKDVFLFDTQECDVLDCDKFNESK